MFRNITLIGTEGRARIAGEFSVVGGYLFADIARGLYTPPEQVNINLVNLELIRIGIIKLKNTLTTLNVQVVNCTVSKLSKSHIVDSSAAKTTVILKKSIIRHISKGLQVKSREFSLNIESSKIDNSGRSYPGHDCPQFIVTDEFESFVVHFSKSSLRYTFLIDLAASRQNKSSVNITDSIFDDDSKNVKYNGCFSGITLRNTTALIVNSSFTNIISRNSLIKVIASFVTFKQCIFSNISSKLSMFSFFSSSLATFNKTNAIYKNLNGFNHGSVYLQSTKGIFHNCTFHNSTVNGQYGKGGAISAVDNSRLQVQKCLFKENKATYFGGAINIQKSQSLFINCAFERNTVKSFIQKRTYGGAIGASSNSHLKVHQCHFKDNMATYGGGAICIQKCQSLFERCIFERNKVISLQQNTFGGAISATGAGTNITIKQCLFKENTATYSGGAIAMEKTRGSFVNCTFERNSLKGRLQKYGFGGAICALHNSSLTMHWCVFKENAANYRGGAICIQKCQSLFERCIFERNKVISLQQNTFGGAISATGAGTNITIKQCLFKENTATYSGGAIAMEKTRGSFVNCTFERNSVKSRLQNGDFGGAMCALGTTYLTIRQCIFKQNTATYSGGATFIQKSESLFESCIFERNKVNSLRQNTFGGAISATDAGTDITKGRLQKYGFGGAICALHNWNLTMHWCVFKENAANYRGGATYIQKCQSLFESCIFERNKVISLQQNTFGGAISATDAGTNITIKQCLFKENKAVGSGGAIFIAVSRSLLLKNCTFESNMVRNITRKKARGGAIFSLDNSDMIVQQCLFKENTAAYSGGAIHMIKTRGSFGNCTFIGNSVKNLEEITFGGAISSENGSSYLMEQCLFNDVMAVT